MVINNKFLRIPTRRYYPFFGALGRYKLNHRTEIYQIRRQKSNHSGSRQFETIARCPVIMIKLKKSNVSRMAGYINLTYLINQKLRDKNQFVIDLENAGCNIAIT